MKNTVMQICALSVFCGIALCLTPEGGVKKATKLCCMLLMMITVLSALRSFDYSEYSLELARYREKGNTLADKAQERSERLNRLVIERECAAYIRKQAELLGINELHAEPGLRWDSAGVWVPESVRLSGTCTCEQKERLQSLISAELGIDAAHQEWITDET